jgi:hypothetical protein
MEQQKVEGTRVELAGSLLLGQQPPVLEVLDPPPELDPPA